MTFRNNLLLFLKETSKTFKFLSWTSDSKFFIFKSSPILLVFLLLTSCKSLRYYNSATNPAGISVIMKSPNTFYTNVEAQDSLSFYLVNNNSEMVIISHWWSDLFLIGQSRFYTKEITICPQPLDLRIKAVSLEPNDTVLLIKVPMKIFLGSDKNWIYKTKNVLGPHLVNQKKFYPYIYYTAELSTKLTNQDEVIKIRSEKIKINIVQFKESTLKIKNIELGISTDVKFFDTDEKKGNLLCKINNLSDYPIPLFIDAGSVKFKLYGYSPNRTAIMFTEFVLDNGKLPVAPVTINSKLSNTFIIPLEQVLFVAPPKSPMYYWSWNKKNPPVSPLVYGKNEVGTEVEFWFGIVVEGKEYFSNTIRLSIQNKKKEIIEKK